MRLGKCLAAILLTGGTFALASCQAPATADQPKDGITRGAACSSNNSSGMYQSTQFPAVDEGNGRVGLLYTGSGDVIMPDEAYGYYSLHDCQTGRQRRIDAYMMRDTRYRGKAVSLQAFVAAARVDGLMSHPDRLMTVARKAGFGLGEYHWDQQAIDDDAACACALFYPDAPAPVADKGATP